MTYTLRLQLHSSLSTYSSGDIFMYKDITKKVADTLNQDKGNITVFENITIIYTEDETYSHSFRNPASKEQMDDLAQIYIDLGYSETPTKRYSIASEGACELRRLAYIEESKKIGRLIIDSSKYDEMKPEDYQGGFSDEVFNIPNIQEYVSCRSVWGYLGAMERLIPIDVKIEEVSRKYLSQEDVIKVLGTWLTSSSGRHFNDNVEPDTVIDENFIQNMVDDVNEWNSESIKLVA